MKLCQKLHLHTNLLTNEMTLVHALLPAGNTVHGWNR